MMLFPFPTRGLAAITLAVALNLTAGSAQAAERSEERRVGKECRL